MNRTKRAPEVRLDSLVRINEAVVFRKLEAEGLLVRLDTTEYFGLDPVGSRIWSLLEQGKSLPEVLRELLNEYECQEPQCTRDLLGFVAGLAEHGLVLLDPAPPQTDRKP